MIKLYYDKIDLKGSENMKNNKSLILRIAVIVIAAVLVLGFIIMPFIN